MEELTNNSCVDSELEVCVCKNDKRVVTSQFEGNMLQIFTTACLASNVLAYRGRTGKGNKAWDRVRYEVITDLCASTHNYAKHARWKSSLFKNFG
ncbi:hypothetical protein D3C84_1036640 [compost metagenome]